MDGFMSCMESGVSGVRPPPGVRVEGGGVVRGERVRGGALYFRGI